MPNKASLNSSVFTAMSIYKYWCLLAGICWGCCRYSSSALFL